MPNYISNEALSDKIDAFKQDFKERNKELFLEIKAKHDLSMEFKKEFKQETEEWRRNASKENQNIIQILRNQEKILLAQEHSISNIKRDVLELQEQDKIHKREITELKHAYEQQINAIKEAHQEQIKLFNTKFDELTTVSINKLGKGLLLVVGSVIGWVAMILKDIILKYF